jgi:hypothetical protein
MWALRAWLTLRAELDSGERNLRTIKMGRTLRLSTHPFDCVQGRLFENREGQVFKGRAA